MAPRALLASAVSIAIAGCGASSPGSTSGGSFAPPASSLKQQLIGAVKEVQPEVAQIRTSTGLGSGVIFDEAGDIVTNAHVVGDATDVVVTLADGSQHPGTLRGGYVPDDLAVIKINAKRKLKPAQFADSSRIEVGEMVLAAGNPLGLQSSVTDGIVSALGRSVVEGRGVVLPNVIQTSAPINPGNSGGALVNLSGQVIGIPTVAAVNPQLGTVATGIGFAIPSNTVRDIAGQIVKNGRVTSSHRAALGAHFADSLTRTGALVIAVEAGGPAAKAGINVGDSIDAFEGRTVSGAAALATALASRRPGQTVTVRITRPDRTSATVALTLGELPGA
jgi:S1-C subfamily serine protease